jgi:hypothetical protein
MAVIVHQASLASAPVDILAVAVLGQEGDVLPCWQAKPHFGVGEAENKALGVMCELVYPSQGQGLELLRVKECLGWAAAAELPSYQH